MMLYYKIDGQNVKHKPTSAINSNSLNLPPVSSQAFAGMPHVAVKCFIRLHYTLYCFKTKAKKIYISYAKAFYHMVGLVVKTQIFGLQI